MLYAEPLGLLSLNYRVRSDDRDLTELRFATFREAATFTLEGQSYTLGREGRGGGGAFVLATAEGPVATARKPSAFRKRFEVEHGSGSLVLESASAWKTAYRLSGGGEIRLRTWFSRTIEADLPADLPLAVQLFAVGLVLVLVHRDAAVVAGGTAVAVAGS